MAGESIHFQELYEQTFVRAAKEFNAWFLVRKTNPASEPYVGKSGYTPKPFECKAKTLDMVEGFEQVAGLVADPGRYSGAFQSASKRRKAILEWRDFAAEFGLENYAQGADKSPESSTPDATAKNKSAAGKPIAGQPPSHGYTVDSDPKSPRFGCAMFQGNYIHGDCDLYDVVFKDHVRCNIAAVENYGEKKCRTGPHFRAYRDYINHQFGVDMIQHPAQAQYADHSDEEIDVFSPQGNRSRLLGLSALIGWYTGHRRKLPLPGYSWA